jgi:hypothetical protein
VIPTIEGPESKLPPISEWVAQEALGHSRGVLDKVLVGERVLVFEQEVVHLPKPTLNACDLGGLSCMGGVSVYVCQREVPEGKIKSIAQLLLNSPHDWICFPSMWTFIITVFKE